MTTTTLIQLSPDDLQAMLERVVSQPRPAPATPPDPAPRKHAYTVAEAAEQIGYSKAIVLRFIREGTLNSRGKRIYLRALELTRADYRITPDDLDRFLNQF